VFMRVASGMRQFDRIGKSTVQQTIFSAHTAGDPSSIEWAQLRVWVGGVADLAEHADHDRAAARGVRHVGRGLAGGGALLLHRDRAPDERLVSADAR